MAEDIISGVVRIHRDNPGLDLPEDWQVSFLLARPMRGLPGVCDQFDRDPDVFRPAVEALWDALIAAGACESRPVNFDGTPSDDDCDRAEFMDDMFLSFTEAFVQVKQPGGGLAAAFRLGQERPITLLPPVPRFSRRFGDVMSATYHAQLARGQDANIVLSVEQLGALAKRHPSRISRYLSAGKRYGLLREMDRRFDSRSGLAKLWRFNLASKLYLPPEASCPARGSAA